MLKFGAVGGSAGKQFHFFCSNLERIVNFKCKLL